LETDETRLSPLGAEAGLAELKGKRFDRDKITVQHILIDSERRAMELEKNIDEREIRDLFN